MLNGTYVRWEKGWNYPVLISSNCQQVQAGRFRLDFSSIVFHSILQPYLHTYHKCKHRETYLFIYCLSMNISISFMLPCCFILRYPKHHWIRLFTGLLHLSLSNSAIAKARRELTNFVLCLRTLSLGMDISFSSLRKIANKR